MKDQLKKGKCVLRKDFIYHIDELVEYNITIVDICRLFRTETSY